MNPSDEIIKFIKYYIPSHKFPTPDIVVSDPHEKLQSNNTLDSPNFHFNQNCTTTEPSSITSQFSYNGPPDPCSATDTSIHSQPFGYKPQFFHSVCDFFFIHPEYSAIFAKIASDVQHFNPSQHRILIGTSPELLLIRYVTNLSAPLEALSSIPRTFTSNDVRITRSLLVILYAEEQFVQITIHITSRDLHNFLKTLYACLEVRRAKT